MEYIDVKEASIRWRVTERRVTALCRTGKIDGAVKIGKSWKIPFDMQKPADGRKREEMRKLPLPIGVSDFIKATQEYYYVDKTLLIKDIIDTRPQVSLFTRPRRFGKTLNMDMLRTFFEKTDEDTSVYFKDKLIWQQGEKYREYQGKYPVIYFTFKDVKRDSWEETYQHITDIIRSEFERHSELLSSDKCSEYEKDYCRAILGGTASETDYMTSLKNLSLMLDKHFGVAPVIIIDEYDTPIQQGYSKDFYDKIILFMRNLFSGGFKDNKHLTFGFMTGILRVAKESIFSGMNNLKENSIMDNRFSEYFGFTKSEVKSMLRYYGYTDKLTELGEWYDGYAFGNSEIYNPWSVINYIDCGCLPNAFWQATGSNDIIRQIVSEANEEIKDNLQLLMQGKTVSAYIDTAVIYPEIKNNPSTVYSFLLVAGYLKVVNRMPTPNGTAVCELQIPNKEIYCVYGKEILSALSPVIRQSTAIAIQQAIISKDMVMLRNHLSDFLRQTISVFDTGEESFYQGLMLGLYSIMNNMYEVKSNRESGDGRYDIQMKPYDGGLDGIIVELKVARNYSGDIQETLKKLSQTALKQIDDKKYAYEMKAAGIKTVTEMGIAFYKKEVQISYKTV